MIVLCAIHPENTRKEAALMLFTKESWNRYKDQTKWINGPGSGIIHKVKLGFPISRDALMDVN